MSLGPKTRNGLPRLNPGFAMQNDVKEGGQNDMGWY